jgi:hypothetical protein
VIFGLPPALVFLMNAAFCWRSGIDMVNAWTERVLAVTDQNAIVITHQDYDIYSLWYATHAVGERPDILLVGANFLRFDWYETMVPSDTPDELGRKVTPTPTPLLESTLQGHIEAITDGVLQPNLDVVPIYITDSDPLVIRELQGSFNLTPVAQLLTQEEAEAILTRHPTIPPPTLYRIERR